MEDYRRNNAMQLLALFVSTEAPSEGAMSSAWVLELMTQNGFDDLRLLSGLNYPGKAAAASGWNAAA
jgi:hypothetical protein